MSKRELRAANGIPPVWADRWYDESRYPVRQFSALRHPDDRRRRVGWSSSRFCERIAWRGLPPPDVRSSRSAAAASSAAPSLTSP